MYAQHPQRGGVPDEPLYPAGDAFFLQARLHRVQSHALGVGGSEAGLDLPQRLHVGVDTGQRIQQVLLGAQVLGPYPTSVERAEEVLVMRSVRA